MLNRDFVGEKTWAIDRIEPGDRVALTDMDLTLDLTFLAGLNEAEHGQLTFVLQTEGASLEELTVPIELLARDEWGGIGDMSRILAAFVSPNDSRIAAILKQASNILESAGHSPSLEGYQSGDPRPDLYVGRRDLVVGDRVGFDLRPASAIV